MYACFHSSNSLARTTETVPSVRSRVPINAGRKFPVHQSKRVGIQFSISCKCVELYFFSYFPLRWFTCSPTLHYALGWCSGCLLGSNSPSPEDERSRTLNNADWRSFRARLVAGENAFRSEVATPVIDLDTVVDQAPAVTIGDKWAHTIHEPEKGCLLIATEKLDGVHIFERTVILLLATGPIGPTGIILNRPSLMSIKEMKASSALDAVGTFSDRPLFFGGPLEEGFFLVSPEYGKDGVEMSGVFEEVMKGLYCGTKEVVGCAAEMVKRNVVGVAEFRFFDGYCAWEKEQLRREIRSGYWTVAACSPSVVGQASVGTLGLWEEILGLMGRRRVW